jgi:hypothetical protein
METLTIQIPDNLFEYFLEFDSKEEYLQKRSEWKEMYKWLTRAIRHNKKYDRITGKIWHKLMKRMHKKGWTGVYMSWVDDIETYNKGRDEFNARYKVAVTGIPEPVSLLGLDATELLTIRAEMKVESSKQREASLACKS